MGENGVQGLTVDQQEAPIQRTKGMTHGSHRSWCFEGNIEGFEVRST